MNKLFQLIISVIIFGALFIGLNACSSETETLDLDRDGDAIADVTDGDSDGDGVSDDVDAFPYDASETTDTDGDGVGDNTDALPDDATASVDSDGDGVGDNNDAFPNDATETIDSDGDGVGDNADDLPNDTTASIDSDGDGVGDNADAFPNDATETVDTDGDGIGDNADALPNDATASVDTDGDGVGDNVDAFPNDATETTDTDGDGIGDNVDAFPNDATETADTDGDGVGDNADVFPNDATETADTDGDGIGDNSDITPFDIAYILNDTGITWGGNYPDGNNTTCIGETIAEQDCSKGRDVTNNDDANGYAGFSFTKIDSNGNVLPASASSWACVLDSVTGLMWEVKTDDGGVHDRDNTYSWGGKTARLTGTFGTVYNDWDTLVDGANSGAGLCGYTGWFVPSTQALRSIVNYDGVIPTIDTDYFPNTKSWFYWSASPDADLYLTAWGVSFSDGNSDDGDRSNNLYVRLVRVGQ